MLHQRADPLYVLLKVHVLGCMSMRQLGPAGKAYFVRMSEDGEDDRLVNLAFGNGICSLCLTPLRLLIAPCTVLPPLVLMPTYRNQRHNRTRSHTLLQCCRAIYGRYFEYFTNEHASWIM